MCNIMINHLGFSPVTQMTPMRSNCLLSKLCLLTYYLCVCVCVCVCVSMCVSVCLYENAYLKLFISVDRPQNMQFSKVKVASGRQHELLIARDIFRAQKGDTKSVAYLWALRANCAMWSLSFAIDFHVISFGC